MFIRDCTHEPGISARLRHRKISPDPFIYLDLTAFLNQSYVHPTEVTLILDIEIPSYTLDQYSQDSCH